jgi:hypothetical protein
MGITPLDSILIPLKQISIRGEVREKRFSNRDFLRIMGYSETANKSLERLLSGEQEPTLEQLHRLEVGIKALLPLDSTGDHNKEVALEKLNTLLYKLEENIKENTSEILSDLASATPTDLAEGKQYFQRYFREFSLTPIRGVNEVRKALVGLAYHAGQNCTHFYMTMTTIRSIWQESDKSSDKQEAREIDRLARLFMRLLRYGYNKNKLKVSLIWQLPKIETDKLFESESVKPEDTDSPYVVAKEYHWLRKCLTKQFSTLRHLIPNDVSLLKAHITEATLDATEEAVFPPSTDLVCAYNTEKPIVYGGLLFSKDTQQTESAYLISETVHDSLIVKHCQEFTPTTNSSFVKQVLKERYHHEDFENLKLEKETAAAHIYVRSYDFPTILKSIFEFRAESVFEVELRNQYVKFLRKENFDFPEKILPIMEARVKLFNQSFQGNSQKFRLILPAEAIFAVTDEKLREKFGFRGVLYTSELIINKYWRLRKLYDLLEHYPDSIFFSSNSFFNSEIRTSTIFPNKLSYLVAAKDGEFEKGKFSGFIEKRDSSVHKEHELHFEIKTTRMILGALFSFQNKWKKLQEAEEQKSLKTEVKQYLNEQLAIMAKIPLIGNLPTGSDFNKPSA